MTWVLVMYIYAGMMAQGDSVTLATIEGFSSQATCQQAGDAAKGFVNNTSKNYKFVCVQKK